MLNERIRELLGTKVDIPSQTDFDKLYHEKFRESGARKAVEILHDLLGRPDVDLGRCAYFSVGGSTGVELAHVLINSPISYGILLEYNPNATDIAEERKQELQNLGKTLIIVTGDAFQQLERCKDQLLQWRKADVIDGTIVSMQAVLHELPTRSPGFDLNHFIGEITWDWDPFILYAREPCEPSEWPQDVEIQVPNVTSTTLEALANEIRVRVQPEGHVLRAGPDFVSMPRALAVETLTKIFYLEDYHHEIQEQVTSFNPSDFIAILEKYLGQNSTTLTRLTSESFTQRWRELGVSARKPPLGSMLSIPPTFARIIAERVTGTRGRFAADFPKRPLITEGDYGEFQVVDEAEHSSTQILIAQRAVNEWLHELFQSSKYQFQPMETLISDPIHGTIRLEKHETAILDAPIMQRLRRIHLAGLASFVYPNMQHTRFEHNLGVLSITQQILDNIEKRVEIDNLTRLHIRLAALLHNVGSLPFSEHGSRAFDQEHGDWLQQIRSETHEGIERFFELSSPSEILSYFIINSQTLKSFMESVISASDRDAGLDSELDLHRVGRIVIGRPVVSTDRWASNLLTSPFGPESLDQLIRDSFHSGLENIVDLGRIVNSFLLVDANDGGRNIALRETVLGVLEGSLLQKIQMDLRVSNHHTIRALSCMVCGNFEDPDSNQSRGLPSTIVEWLQRTDIDFLPSDSRVSRRDIIRRCLVIDQTTIEDDGRLPFAALASSSSDFRTLRPLREKIYGIIPDTEKTTLADFWIDTPDVPAFIKHAGYTLIQRDSGETLSWRLMSPTIEFMRAQFINNVKTHVFYADPLEHRKAAADATQVVLQEQFGLRLKTLARDLAMPEL